MRYQNDNSILGGVTFRSHETHKTKTQFRFNTMMLKLMIREFGNLAPFLKLMERRIPNTDKLNVFIFFLFMWLFHLCNKLHFYSKCSVCVTAIII